MHDDWNIKEHYEAVKTRVKNAIVEAGRAGDNVRILAVSKGQSIEKIKALYDLGHRDFGENYVQELEEKRLVLQDYCPDIRWHYIGNVQTNKSQLMAKNFAVHSVASLKQAKYLAKYREAQDPLNIFLQVNFNNEAQKKYFSENSLRANICKINQIAELCVLGFMTILPLKENQRNKHWFLRLKTLRDDLQRDLNIKLPELSMGMSNDFEEAIKYGSTWLRIGLVVFGARKYKLK